MRRFAFVLVLVVVIAGLLAGGLIGCGGGKGESRVLRGVANVNAATTSGRVATCYLRDPNSSDSDMLTDTSGGIARSPSGWKDEPWACPWPRAESVDLWAFVAFNDYNHNSRFDPPLEILGSSNLFLTRTADGHFLLVDGNANIVSAKPETASIYIDCSFAQRSRVDTTSLGERLKTVRARLH